MVCHRRSCRRCGIQTAPVGPANPIVGHRSRRRPESRGGLPRRSPQPRRQCAAGNQRSAEIVNRHIDVARAPARAHVPHVPICASGMEIYLPIAEMSVQWLVILGMGFGVGFLSGLFGVGGGFLLTPLLVFYGIPSGIAVATTLSHVTASSISGALAQWRKRAIDFKMAGVMLCGGFTGTGVGVWLFT